MPTRHNLDTMLECDNCGFEAQWQAGSPLPGGWFHVTSRKEASIFCRVSCLVTYATRNLQPEYHELPWVPGPKRSME